MAHGQRAGNRAILNTRFPCPILKKSEAIVKPFPVFELNGHFNPFSDHDFPWIHHTTKIWQPHLVNIYGNCIIGERCNIGSFVEIGPGVEIGNDVRIGAFCFIPSGVKIGDDCFVGPGTIFTNDLYPPSHKEAWLPIVVGNKTSIGAGCVILPGVTIGERVMIGAGSVISKNIPDGIRVVGNPARRLILPTINCEKGIIG